MKTTPQRLYTCVLGANLGFKQSHDCPVQTSDSTFAQIILGLSPCQSIRIEQSIVGATYNFTLYIYSSDQDTVNVPKPLSLLAEHVPRPSDTASLIVHKNSSRR